MKYRFVVIFVLALISVYFITRANEDKKMKEWVQGQEMRHRAEDRRRALELAGKELRVIKSVRPLNRNDIKTPWTVTFKTHQGTIRTWQFYCQDLVPFLTFGWLDTGFTATVVLNEESTTILPDDPNHYEDRSYRYLLVSAIKDKQGMDVSPNLAIDQFNDLQDRQYELDRQDAEWRNEEWRRSPSNPDNNLLLQHNNPANPISPFNPMNQPTYNANR